MLAHQVWTHHRAADHWEVWISWSHHLISSVFTWAYSFSQTVSRLQGLQLTPSRRMNHSSLPCMKPGHTPTSPKIYQRKCIPWCVAQAWQCLLSPFTSSTFPVFHDATTTMPQRGWNPRLAQQVTVMSRTWSSGTSFLSSAAASAKEASHSSPETTYNFWFWVVYPLWVTGGNMPIMPQKVSRPSLPLPMALMASTDLVLVSKSLFWYGSVMAEDFPHTEQQIESLETPSYDSCLQGYQREATASEDADCSLETFQRNQMKASRILQGVNWSAWLLSSCRL